MDTLVQNFSYYKDLVLVLTAKEIKVKYKNSLLGYVWSVLNPLCLAVVFYFAFKFVMKVPVENFTLFLISGLFPWQWFSTSVNASITALFGNASLVKKVSFPRYFIPLATVLNDTFHFVVSLPIVFGFVVFYKVHLTAAWVYGIPLLMVSQFFMTYGCALAVSALNLFFRDLERLVMIGLTVLFYMTPIIYDISLVPEGYRQYFLLNPLFAIIEGWHSLFLRGHVDWGLYLVSLLQSLVIFGVGFALFKKLSWKFAEVL